MPRSVGPLWALLGVRSRLRSRAAIFLLDHCPRRPALGEPHRVSAAPGPGRLGAGPGGVRHRHALRLLAASGGRRHPRPRRLPLSWAARPTSLSKRPCALHCRRPWPGVPTSPSRTSSRAGPRTPPPLSPPNAPQRPSLRESTGIGGLSRSADPFNERPVDVTPRRPASPVALRRAQRDHRGGAAHQVPRLGGLREQVQGRGSDEDPAVRERLQRARGGRGCLTRAGR